MIKTTFLFIACSFAVVSRAASDTQYMTISSTTLSKIISETLPGNLLPNFLFMQGAIEGGSVGVNIGGGRGNPKVYKIYLTMYRY